MRGRRIAKDMLLVSAADASHFRSLMQLLRTAAAKDKDLDLVVYDLGFSPGQAELLTRRFPDAELRRFDFSAYPPHVDIRVRVGEYAWKPALIWETVERASVPVCWMDAGNALLGRLDGIRDLLRKRGFYSPYSPGTVAEWTHPGMATYLGMDLGPVAGSRNLNGACVAFDPQSEPARRLAKEWRDLALVKECIAPEGSSRANHRQDQSLLTLLAYRKGLAPDSDPGYLGFTIHQDVEGSRLKTAIRTLKRTFASWGAVQ